MILAFITDASRHLALLVTRRVDHDDGTRVTVTLPGGQELDLEPAEAEALADALTRAAKEQP